MFDALTVARGHIVEAVAESVLTTQVTGIRGEADVGKSALVAAALASVAPSVAVVRLDLDGCYSAGYLAWRWARGLTQVVVGGPVLSHVASLDPGLWPSSTRQAVMALPNAVGEDVAALALAAGPEQGTPSFDEVIAATCRLAHPTRPVVVVVDHLETPVLSGALDLDAMLWQLRAATQRTEAVRVLLVGRPRSVDLVTGEDAAFFGDGRWLDVDNPTPGELSAAYREWKGLTRVGLHEPITHAWGITGGHPTATRALVTAYLRYVAEGERASDDTRWARAMEDVARDSLDLGRRSVQHARSLHRLGGHLLAAIARNERPYSAAPDARGKDVAAAIRSLHLAGLIRRGLEPKSWRVTDPRVGWILDPARVPVAPRIDLTASHRRALRARDGALDHLTSRQQDVLRLLADDLSTDEMADAMSVSVETVRSHVKSLMAKFGVHSRRELVAAAFLVDAPSIVARRQAVGPVGAAEATDMSAEEFGAFYKRFATKVMTFFVRRVLDTDIATDLTAETFARAFEHRDRFHGKTAADEGAWLFGIARAQLSSYWRMGRVEQETLVRIGLEAPELEDAELRRIEEMAGLEALKDRVASALRHLPHEQAWALRERVINERGDAELAAETGVSVATFRKRVSRALGNLSRSVEAMGTEPFR